MKGTTSTPTWSWVNRALAILLLLTTTTNGNICNDYATLIEKDKFYVTQPFQAELDMNLNKRR